MKLFGDIETALNPQVNVYQCDIRVQLLVKGKRFSAIGGRTDDADPRACKQGARRVAEISAVINDQTAHRATHGRTQNQTRRSQMASHPS